MSEVEPHSVRVSWQAVEGADMYTITFTQTMGTELQGLCSAAHSGSVSTEGSSLSVVVGEDEMLRAFTTYSITVTAVSAVLGSSEVEASLREARVPREGDPVSALPTTPCVSSTSGSSPFCLLDVRLVLWGLWEAIIANNSLLSACVMSDTYPCS